MSILTLNAGSSSLKFAVFSADQRPGSEALLHGSVAAGTEPAYSLARVLEAATPAVRRSGFSGVGHRIVHGGEEFCAPRLFSEAMMAGLKRLVPFAPEHLPAEIALVEQVAQRFPGLPQVLCFDTAFHRDLPRMARLLPIPRRYEAAGLRRYGFHGLSFEFLRAEMTRLGDPTAVTGRVILAHLGNGASLAALRDGACVDTSMGFTPSAGLVMATRSGDIDPGVAAYLAQSEGMSAGRLNTLFSHESGMLGVSETSGDMRKLLESEKRDPRAAEAVALFCYQAKKWTGAFVAVLGGLDTLVFAGGVGENCAAIRMRICDGLGFLGIELDHARNAAHAPVISGARSRVIVRVMRTNEELVIARAVSALLHPGGTDR